ncbi:MAG: hypothetical protein ACPGJF_05615 [Sinimarinibacterium flocculans]|uniref:hypothetical protein n=1 Tax=Sinimarinibacterium flocculans TaxID=985250 RepID=UPI003C423A8D
MDQLPEGFFLDEQDAMDGTLPEGFVLDANEAPEHRGITEEAGRQLGLTGRYLAEGAASTVGILADPIGALVSKVTGKPYQPLSRYVANQLTRAGVPEPQTARERVVGDASRAMVSGGAMIRGAQSAQQLPGMIGKASTVLAQQPGIQGATAASGASAASVTSEAGGGPVAQTAAGIAGSLLPSAGVLRDETVRRAFRGGEAGRQRVEQNLETFEAAGTTPTVGQATESRFHRGAESLLGRAPGSAGRIAQKADSQSAEIGAGLERVAAALTPRSSAERAGRKIEAGIRDAFLPRFRARAGTLFDEVDLHLPPDVRVPLAATQRALDELSKPSKGVERTSAALMSPKIAQIREGLQADLAGGDATTYGAAKWLRSLVGRNIEESALVADIPKAQLRRLYGALTTDIEEAAKATGNPQALAALSRANRYYRAGLDRIDTIENVINRSGGPERIFAAATSGTREGATTLRALMQSLPEDAQKEVAATVLRRLGRANPGNQDDLGEVFSTSRFLTNWAAMSPEGKRTLFDRFGPEYRRNMDQIAKVASNLRSGSAVFANPSRTSDATIQASTVGALALALMTGQLGAAAAIGTGLGGARVTANVMTNPAFVHWLAQSTKQPIGALPAQVYMLQNIAERTGDADIAEAAEALRELQQGPDEER